MPSATKALAVAAAYGMLSLLSYELKKTQPALESVARTNCDAALQALEFSKAAAREARYVPMMFWLDTAQYFLKGTTDA